MYNPSGRRHDPDLVVCSECGSTFDLARQNYYDDTCPACRMGLQ